MKIQVTQEDIDKSERRPPFSQNCLIATALARATGKQFAVGHAMCYDDESAFSREISLPKIVQDAIEAWDNGQPVQPFEFEIDL